MFNNLFRDKPRDYPSDHPLSVSNEKQTFMGVPVEELQIDTFSKFAYVTLSYSNLAKELASKGIVQRGGWTYDLSVAPDPEAITVSAERYRKLEETLLAMLNGYYRGYLFAAEKDTNILQLRDGSGNERLSELAKIGSALYAIRSAREAAEKKGNQ